MGIHWVWDMEKGPQGGQADKMADLRVAVGPARCDLMSPAQGGERLGSWQDLPPAGMHHVAV